MPPTSRVRLAGAAITAVGLSAITGIVSYEHGLEVVRLAGNTGLAAYLVPLVPDLMIVTSSMTLMEASATRARRPVMSMLNLAAGIGWTVAVNVAAGWRHGGGSALIAGGIPLAFVLTFEALLWLLRRGRDGASDPAVPSACDHLPPLSLDDAIRAAYPVLASQRATAEAFGVSKGKVQSLTTRPAEIELASASMNGDGHDH